MIYKVFILSLTFFTISSHCMDEKTIKQYETNNSKKKKKKPHKSKSLSLKSDDCNKFIHINTHKEHPFIIAAQNKDHPKMRFLLSNSHFNPNVQEKFSCKNTAFHYCAKNNDYDMIEQLLLDPRIDSSIANSGDKTAKQLLDCSIVTEDTITIDYQTRQKLFARLTLDIETNKTCHGIKNTFLQNEMTPELLTCCINHIKETIQKIENKQSLNKDRNLHELARFPSYADEQFMQKKIWFILEILKLESLKKEY